MYRGACSPLARLPATKWDIINECNTLSHAKSGIYSVFEWMVLFLLIIHCILWAPWRRSFALLQPWFVDTGKTRPECDMGNKQNFHKIFIASNWVMIRLKLKKTNDCTQNAQKERCINMVNTQRWSHTHFCGIRLDLFWYEHENKHLLN